MVSRIDHIGGLPHPGLFFFERHARRPHFRPQPETAALVAKAHGCAWTQRLAAFQLAGGSQQRRCLSMHTVFVVASNVFVRESLIRLLSRDKGMRLAGGSDWSLTVGEEISHNHPEIVLVCPEPLDTSFPLIAEMHKQVPEARILLIGMRDDMATFVRAVRSGVAGYLLDSVPGKAIVAAVRQVGGNSVVYPPHLEWAYFHALAANPSAVPSCKAEGASTITHREWEVAQLICGGLTNKEIASRLNLSVQTVKAHVHGLLQKTECANREDLVRTVRIISATREPGVRP